MGLRDDLLTIERALWTGGPEAYQRHVDAECLIAFTEMAGAYSREEVAAMVEAGPRWHDVNVEPVGLIQPADDVAVLTYRGSAVRDEDEHYTALVSSGYIRREDGWKLTFHQQTPLAD